MPARPRLLRLCAGLAHVSSGEAVVLGCDLAHDPRAVRARVGLLGHATALYDDLNVVDNIRFWSRAAGARSADTEEAIEQLGLGGRLARVPVARLSAGQRRRAALAILVARRPELWLLDEPHAGLDATGRDLVDDLVRRAAAAGATVLIASHELDRAVPLAGRTVTIVGGRVQPAQVSEGRVQPAPSRRPSVFRDAALVAGKDLRIEARSRVATNQIGPFALLVLILFAFALDPDRGILTRATAGLFWITVLFCTLLAIQRAFSIESADGNRDALRLTTLDPAGIFLGKAAAVALELLGLEVLLLLGVVVLYDASLNSAGLLVLTALAATAGLASAGTLYGVLAAGLRVRETLLPLLLLPVVAPVLIGATRAFEAALSGSPLTGGRGSGSSASSPSCTSRSDSLPSDRSSRNRDDRPAGRDVDRHGLSEVHRHEGDAHARHRVSRGHRAARVPRSRRHSRGRGAARHGAHPLHPRAGRVGRVPRVRCDRAVERALPLEAHPVAHLGPPRGRLG